ncbi:MAG: hypothetical protein U5L96_10635 [Owenweeksia sp.]|nr:hypothetical protein [Owenweeksia sp.]
MNKTQAGCQSVDLHRLTTEWGEGSSDASGSEGSGTTAQTNDATWVHAFFNTTTWSTNGGDYSSTSSATQSVAGNGSYNWSSAALANDVQLFLDSANQNHGWILIGNEASNQTAKRFGSRDGTAFAVPTS